VHSERFALALLQGAFLLMRVSAAAQSVSDYAIQASARVGTNPPQILLSWPADPQAASYTVYRKSRDATDWGTGTALAASASSYLDTKVARGNAYEYRLSKVAANYSGEGYIYAGIELAAVERRGKVVLLVDNTVASNLATEITRLQQDLVGDGWTVLRHDVARAAVDPATTDASAWSARAQELAAIKAVIQSDYAADPTNLKAVFLLGHLAVPYSGDLNPDGHTQHLGAWPADAYYGEVNGRWSDAFVNDAAAGDARNYNVVGDAKLDQTVLPSNVELQVGRVDLAKLPAFSQSEVDLLRRYLDKDHAFRHALFTAEKRGLIDDHFGTFNGEAFAVNGWRNFAPFFDASNSVSADWRGTLSGESYLWGYGCGPGDYTGASGVVSTSDLAASDPRVVFTMYFGSYFGDWDSQNNLMRATIATPSYTLTSAWAGRPYWAVHHMGLGETIGFSTRLSQNNAGLYVGNYCAHWIHVALMGDPTLRMHPVVPPSALAIAPNPGTGVDLTWTPSPDAVVGYYMYRAATAAGPFTRLNNALLTRTYYTDSALGSYVYMLRAVKLEATPSGSYYNLSQGIFQNLAGSFPALPLLTITAQSTNKVYGEALPEFAALYDGFVNGDTPASVSPSPTLTTSATPSSPAGRYSIHVSGAGATNYVVRTADGTLTILPATPTGTLSASANPCLPGEPVVLTFILEAAAPSGAPPTGAVRFRVDGLDAGAPVPLDSGMANLTNSTLSHGLHFVSVEYAGDANFTGTTNSLSPDLVVDSPPLAGVDTVSRDPAGQAKVPLSALLNNDLDPDGDAVSIVQVDSASANGGVVARTADYIIYTAPIDSTNADSFHYLISDSLGATATGLVMVGLCANDYPPASLSVSNTLDRALAIFGQGFPSGAYRLQSTPNLEKPDWLGMGATVADARGMFWFLDTNLVAQRFYRCVCP
jgi:hypothetical protein